ncbi:MAG TPA: glycosyltransferase [Blastocatellia bacterium]|nr:glycosyltransferase [Blastocatellia bacterium]
MVELLIEIIQWFFLLYFMALNIAYLALSLISFFCLSRYLRQHVLRELPSRNTNFEPPISLLVPAYNEEATIAASIRSLLQLDYPEYEIIVINDGSRDETMAVLQAEFKLIPFPDAFCIRLPIQAIRTVYRSRKYPELRVIDKENGGKADALNAGINVSRYPLFCGLDADSILQSNSLRRLVQPFLEDSRTVACGGMVQAVNGCEVSGGFLVRAGLPRNPLALFQIIEYLRAFLFGRMGWSPLNALLIISGAFGLFHKETVIAAGGYLHNTIGEDMELIVRLHRHLRLAGRSYRITFAPDPICWTEVPEDWRTLRNQRRRWQRGLADSLNLNKDIFLHRRGGTIGWLAFPFMVFFELISPVLEMAGYVVISAALISGYISLSAFFAFMLAAIGCGVLFSVVGLFLNEIDLRTYPKVQHLLLLFVVSVAENFGYRQVISFWRFQATIQWLRGQEAAWGKMVRTGAASRSSPPTERPAVASD